VDFFYHRGFEPVNPTKYAHPDEALDGLLKSCKNKKCTIRKIHQKVKPYNEKRITSSHIGAKQSECTGLLKEIVMK